MDHLGETRCDGSSRGGARHSLNCLTDTCSLLETAVFYGEACLFVFLYHSNLVRFIHRFSLVISVKDLLLADVNRQRIIDMIHMKVAKRRTFVKLLCCVGIFFNIAVFGLEARKFSGINVKLTELLTLSLSVATLALYAYLIIFYTRTQSSKFTVDDDKIFEPLETFAEYFTYSGNVLLFPNISFTIQSAY